MSEPPFSVTRRGGLLIARCRVCGYTIIRRTMHGLEAAMSAHLEEYHKYLYKKHEREVEKSERA